MAVPTEIPGLGSSAMVLRVAPGFDPLKAKIGPDEYFLLSRVDGKQSLRDVMLATGLPIDRAIAIALKLRSLGALLLPGETTPAPASAPPTRPPAAAHVDMQTERLPRNLVVTGLDAPTMRRARVAESLATDQRLPDPSSEEVAALTEDSELGDTERRKILAMQRLVSQRDPWALLGVPRGADAKTLKRAYFTLSKAIHPDRYYGKQLGSFAQRLVIVFEATSRAYAKLTSPEPPRPTGPHHAVATGNDQPQTPQEYAAELFDRACGLEVGGDPLEAMKLFAAAVRVDPQARYLRRAASCALAAGQPRTAVEYAKKAQSDAPDDPSAARLLASAFRAAGKLADAEEVLVMAVAMKNATDALTTELRNDLAEVRRQMASEAR